jgi:hypothetical protein
MSLRAARVTLALYLFAIYATLGVVRTITNFLRDRGLLRVSVVAASARRAGSMKGFRRCCRRACTTFATSAGPDRDRDILSA